MDPITDPEEALHYVKFYGYLNEFETPADAWYVACDTPMEAGENNGELISDKAAETLIRQGKVIEVSRGHPPADSTTRVICYRPA